MNDNPNPTEPTDDEFRIVRDIDIEKEQFIRGFFARQRDAQRQSLALVANLAQANIELILSMGLVEVAAKRTNKTVRDTTNIVSDTLLTQRVKREGMMETALDKLRTALDTNVKQEIST
jgi:hypothetical protein